MRKIKTIFDYSNEEVLKAFEEILLDVRAIITDDEYPDMIISGVDPNATRKELGEIYVKHKAGDKIYNWLRVFLSKKPDNVFNILDTIFRVEKGTYRKKSFKRTIKDLQSIKQNHLREMISFMQATGLLK